MSPRHTGTWSVAEDGSETHHYGPGASRLGPLRWALAALGVLVAVQCPTWALILYLCLAWPAYAAAAVLSPRRGSHRA